MLMPLGASVLSLKISLLSSPCLDAVPPFTCLTTWMLLWSARLKCSATGKPPPNVYAVEGLETGVQIAVEEAWTIPPLNLQGAREQTYWRQKGSKDFVKLSVMP